jgi:hypothetical protein
MNISIGLIAGSFKPFTAGHYNLVQKASTECDQVKLFVSTGKRVRRGELGITWEQMQPVWDEYLDPMIRTLGNVDIVYTSQPIRCIYELLIDATDNEYFVYSDPNDARNNYKKEAQLKYWPQLVENDQFHIRIVSRTETRGISGTVMRKALESGDKKTFIEGLPEPVRIHGREIYSMLR